MTSDDERIALFLDYENLAIGARDLTGGALDFRPIADALAERGRVVVRRAYADWSYFEEDRRMLTRHQVELIEIPQRMGAVRKNAADIKMAVDAIELSFERDYITTFVLGTGDSDFTPLVHKLRELNKRVIGIGVEATTSAQLPAACDQVLFYVRLDGGALQVLDFETFGRSEEWKLNVLSNTAVRTIPLSQFAGGKHRLEVSAMDPGFILDRIDVVLEGAPNYYGAP